MNLYYNIEKYDEKGLIYKSKQRKAKSFVKAFLYVLYNRMCANNWNDDSPTENTSGSPQGMFNQKNYRSIYCPEGMNLGPAGTSEWGIVVGSSNSVVQAQHYRLQSKIGNGWGSGQLLYGPHISDDSVTSVEPNASFNISRIFKNYSGGDVPIYEIGYYIYANANGYNYFCLMRDVIAQPVTVSDAQYVKVNYTFQITV